MKITRINRNQVPVERFARDVYRAFSEINPGDLSQNRLLKKAVIEEVELTASLREQKLVIKSLPMFFSYSTGSKEAEIFNAQPKNQASRLEFKEREELIQKIEIGAEYTMALTETDSFAYFLLCQEN